MARPISPEGLEDHLDKLDRTMCLVAACLLVQMGEDEVTRAIELREKLREGWSW